jgi:hypothetical protein
MTLAPSHEVGSDRYWAGIEPTARGVEPLTREEVGMVAKVGDSIVVNSQKVGTPPRQGVILEVIEASYGTRFRVAWADGDESTIRPALGSARTIPQPRKRRK